MRIQWLATALGLALALPPGRGRAERKAARGIDLATAEMVDLTHPFDASTLYWPTSTGGKPPLASGQGPSPSGFELKTLHHGPMPGGWFYAANSFCAPEHGGTHVDAPEHFAEKGESVDALPLGKLIAPAVVIDVAARAEADPDYRLTVEDVRAWEAKHGAIPAGSIVLLRTGWGRRWPDRKRYFGDDKPGDASHLHFPSFGREAVELLVRERRVAAIAVDTASIDHGPSKDFPVHRLVGAANVPGLENVANAERLPETGAWIIALPMKIAGGSGGPARIVALLPRR
jgi:kynurenine formamidase